MASKLHVKESDEERVLMDWEEVMGSVNWRSSGVKERYEYLNKQNGRRGRCDKEEKYEMSTSNQDRDVRTGFTSRFKTIFFF